MAEEKISLKEFKPLPGPKPGVLSKQELALSTNVDILFFGGAAGGSKTYTMLLDDLRNIDLAMYRCLIFRRTFAQIAEQGAIWDDSKNIFPFVGAKPNNSDYYWTFPSGAVVGFAHMNNENDWMNYDGARVPVIKFDQLEQFTERQFWALVGRNSSVNCPELKPYIMASFNPPEDEEHWILKLISWYLDEDGQYPDPAKSGVVRWFIRDDRSDDFLWFDSEEEAKIYIQETYGERRKVRPKSFTFIPATVDDNPAMEEKDPNYVDNLEALSMVDREKKRKGNFKIGYTAGNIFRPEWYPITQITPNLEDIEYVCRAWDKASSEILATSVKKKTDPDFTASCLIARLKNKKYIILDITEFRATPGSVMEIIKATSLNDYQQYKHLYTIALPQDPASAGVFEVEYTTLELAGMPVKYYLNRGSKITRANPASAASERKLISILKAEWNSKLLSQLRRFPGAKHDDMIDAFSLGFSVVAINSMGSIKQAKVADKVKNYGDKYR